MGRAVRAGAVKIPERELGWRFSRSSGPGGQGVNTADSRVELIFDLGASSALSPVQRERAMQRLAGRLTDGVLTVVAAEQRSQLQNRRTAQAKLAELLAEATAPPPAPRRPTRPSRGANRRRLEAKARRSTVKRLRRRPED